MDYVIDWQKSLRYEAPAPWTRYITFLVDNEVFKDPPFDVAIAEYPPGAKCPEHFHENEVEIYMVLKGEITTTMEGKSYRIPEKHLMYVPARKRHQTSNTGSETCIFIAIHTPPDVKETGKVRKEWKKVSP